MLGRRLTQHFQHFILTFCLGATPACLFLPKWSVRSYGLPDPVPAGRCGLYETIVG